MHTPETKEEHAEKSSNELEDGRDSFSTSPSFKKNEILESALLYASRGWAVLPMHIKIGDRCTCHLGPKCSSPGKHPRTKQGVHDATVDQNTIKALWERWPDADIGIATGKISNLVVLDIDPRNGGDYSFEKLKDLIGELPETTQIFTQGKGQHFYFKWPRELFDLKFKGKISDFPGIDILSDGRCVKAPPSKDYFFESSSEDSGLLVAEIPSGLLELITYPPKIESLNLISSDQKVHSFSKAKIILEGERNHSLTSLAGSLRRKGMEEESIYATLAQVNQTQCSPPLSEDEVRSIAKSISKYPPATSSNSQNSTDILIQSGKDWKFFYDQKRNPYVSILQEGKQVIFPISGGDFKDWISGQFYKKYKKAIERKNLENALANFRAKALYDGECVPLEARFAWYKKKLYIDLVDENWQAVQVSEEGWKVLKIPPICHIRHPHQQPLPEPELGGSIEDIFKFIEVKNPNHKLLLLTWLVTAIIPNVPRPILIFYGPQGSGKSQASRKIKMLLDPSVTDFLELKKSENEMAQIFDQHAVPVFDNQGNLNRETANFLCKGVTGGSLSKRRLYTDAEAVYFSFMRPVVLNGINIPSAAPDFLDRSLLIELERINPEKRKTEQEINDHFISIRPRIFGGILDILVEAMKAYPTIQCPSLPRMADYAKWGAVVSLALGYEQQHFLDALEVNSNTQLEEVLENDPLAEALVDFLKENPKWEGTSTQLLLKLEEKMTGNFKSRSWPKSSEYFSKRLRQLQASLLEIGIRIDFLAGRRKGRLIRIELLEQSKN